MSNGSKSQIDVIYENEFLPKIHFWGRLTVSVAIIAALFAPLYLSFVRGYHPGWGPILNGFIGIAGLIGLFWVIEPLSYFPILGPSGTYMSFLSGNISNMRIPVVGAAQGALDAEPGSYKAEMAGAIGIAVSVILNIVFLIVLVLMGSVIISRLPAAITASFVYVIDGIFGAMFILFAMRAKVPDMLRLGGMGAIIFFLPLPGALKAPLGAIIGFIYCVILRKIQKKSEAASSESVS